ncbi:hypothetical protein X875_6970 [Mannheimia varigena USDA-ARS-USMARC-1388]|uniref:Nmad2 family putative nucleotide modification protein n=1 Tax=Mannheimia varigena TaxID=85404 RepID=UPI0003E399E1|nr:hypothetical protein [Mannheimia varigena]AHG79315.1 hypothetical protein X875_6970 [Mannheimia varigena USDA-ARS-USMARC-1388]TLU76510.1 hypothetical protein FE589_03505 [Mannheimia varigena]
MKIKSYVITHDHGFAPNPYGGYLTLATCKPQIRRTANVGDIIVATGSRSGIYKNKLIYAGIICEIMHMDKYFCDPRFEIKKPSNKDECYLQGDNIYYKEHNDWKQLPNNYHDEEGINHDLKSKNVLICEEFWYFGNNAPLIPENLLEIIKIGPAHKNISDPKIISEFLDWISDFQRGLIGKPIGQTSLKVQNCNQPQVSSKCANSKTPSTSQPKAVTCTKNVKPWW